MPSVKFFIALLTFLLTTYTSWSQSSILADGKWVKLAVQQLGIYQLTYNQLSDYGFNPDQINPANIRLFGNGPGMLPQPNSSPRPNDLLEVAISVVGGDDGHFDPTDYILFYASGPDLLRFDTLSASFYYEKHLFANENYYFLTVDNQPGLRIGTQPTLPLNSEYNYAYRVVSHEEDLYNILHSGRQWYGETFDLEATRSFTTNLQSLAPGSTVRVITATMSRSTAPSAFEIFLNDIKIGEQAFAGVPDGTYTRKGESRQDTFDIAADALGNQPLTISYSFQKQSNIGYLDFFAIQARTALTYNNEPLTFFTGDLTAADSLTFRIENCPDGLLLWEISDHNQVKNISYTQNGSTIRFTAPPGNRQYILFSQQNRAFLQPVAAESIANQNLHGYTGADLLIVAAPPFLDQAQRLAALRQQEGLTVIVATTTEVYNEFSSGKPDITAIRDFARYLYSRGGLKYLLLFGKGTYDPKDINGTGMNTVPIYQSRSSLHPLTTYGSDDYLGFMDDDEGAWPETTNGNHILDIGIGRLPAATYQEAVTIVDKLYHYADKATLGAWRKKVVFVAENGDNNIHQRDADRLATLIDTTYAEFDIAKIYVDAYPIVVQPGSNRAPAVNQELYRTINEGTLLINYTGHGNEVQWAKTRIFDKKMIDTLRNDLLPLFITATCEFGRHDDDSQRSGGEDLLVELPSGAIGAITTTRPVFASTNYQLNNAFYQEVFKKVNGEYQRLGDIFRQTKNNSLNNVFNRNFSLLADPSMYLAYPRQTVTLDSLNGEPLTPADTLPALTRLSFAGSVRTATNIPDASFSGKTEIIVYDKAVNRATLGNLGGKPFTYQVRDNILFKGSATVSNGRFAFSLVLPADISYNPGRARFAFYALDTARGQDGSGANIDLYIGKSTLNPIVDTTPPVINLYLGDTTYQPGLPVSSSTLFIAKIYDENGINTSLTQIGHAIAMTLDDQQPVVLNSYYSTAIDDQATGWLYYPLSKLSSGSHTITLTAWDTSNNPATASITFTVLAEGEVQIQNLRNYPNPFNTETTFYIAHNLSGEDLEITLQVINTSGQMVYSQTRSYQSAPAVINDWTWDGRTLSGEKINEGLYIYGIFIRSMNNNLGVKEYSRLFITN